MRALLLNPAALLADARWRAVLLQGAVVAVVGGLGFVLVRATLANMEARGITTGFGFLGRTAGFDIQMTLVDYDQTSTYGRALLVALLNTLLVAVIGIVLASALGFAIGIARLSSNWLVARIAGAYVEIVRNVPLLLQLFFWYFAVLRALPGPREGLELFGAFHLNLRGLYLPRPLFEPAMWAVPAALAAALAAGWGIRRWARRRQRETGRPFPSFAAGLGLVVGLPALAFALAGAPVAWEFPELRGFNLRGGLQLIPEFVALVVSLTMYTAAFIAEIVRAGIQSVGRGQIEAAQSLGLRAPTALRLVVLPQALRLIIPPLTSQYLNLTKNSSLAAAIAYPDLVLVFAGTALVQTGQAVEIIAITMGVYLLLSLFVSAFMNWYNRRTALPTR